MIKTKILKTSMYSFLETWFFPLKKAEILKIIFSGKPPNITLRVMTRIEEPFVMARKEKDGIPLTGNSRFEVYFRFRHFSLRRMTKRKGSF